MKVSNLKAGDKLLCIREGMAGYSKGQIVNITDVDEFCIGFGWYGISTQGVHESYKYVNKDGSIEDLEQ